jgi:hypothetical protein
MKTTRKKTKIIGRETFIKQETGELVQMNVIEVEERDCNFHKLWLGHIIQTLDIIGNKKVKVVNYIMDNISKENIFIKTQRGLVETLGVSMQTINETLKALQENDFLTMLQNGVYRVNPEVIFKGGYNDRLDILLRYRNEREANQDPNEQREAVNQEELIRQKIQALQNELEQLEKSKIKNPLPTQQ